MVRRVIMHVDMDAFYASVELRRRPELRGTAVIVGGFPRGVVLSASYEARACGVRSGMASAQARQLAPRATFVDPDFDSYTAVSQAIAAVFGSVTSVVESASIDEAFLDITGSIRMFGSPTAIGEYVRAVVADEQQITCSVGIGPSKFVAKVGSRQAKPDGLIEVPPDRVADFLHPLPVEAMWGVGPATTERLHRLCVEVSDRTGAACCRNWLGGETDGGSPRACPSAASDHRRRWAVIPMTPLSFVASSCGWPLGRRPVCASNACSGGP